MENAKEDEKTERGEQVQPTLTYTPGPPAIRKNKEIR